MNAPSVQREAIPRVTIALVSATALAAEILLLRLFAIVQWHHFASMAISLALLGYGASGTFLALGRDRLLAAFPLAFIANIFLFSAALAGSFPLAQRLPFHPEEILWNPGQWFKLCIIYLLLALPFFFAANVIALALARFRDNIFRTYAADLLGAGAGSLGIILLLHAVFPGTALRILSSLALLTAAVAWLELRLAPRPVVLGLLLAALLPLLLPAGWTRPIISPYQALSQLLRLTGTRIIAEQSSPLGQLTVVASPVVPLRHAPGLSLMADTEPPPQLALFTDGDSMTAMIEKTTDPEQLAFFDQTATALPYHLARPGHVLVLGSGGGIDVLQALFFQATQITAVELTPQVTELARRFSPDLTEAEARGTLRFVTTEARGFVASSPDRYDLIRLALFDAQGGGAAGLHALQETYPFTVEAFASYLSRLQPGGFLAVSGWVQLPPRDTLKLFATAIVAMEQLGIADPQNRLLLIRSWQSTLLLVKNGPILAREIVRLRDFCQQRAFDVAYYPGMAEAEANRYNLLPEPIFFRDCTALLGPEHDEFLTRYKFHIAPATDDRPFFFRFFTWQSLPELLTLRKQGAMPLLEWGYLVLVATLGQALLASIGLILLPLLVCRWSTRRAGRGSQPGQRLHLFAYFTAIGLAFLFLEIAFIQKLILVLHHPVYAAATAITVFLLGAGLGSASCQRSQRIIRIVSPVVWIVGHGLVALLILTTVGQHLAGLPELVRAGIAVLPLAPLAFWMGMPFPLGLAAVGAEAPELLPWAWAINGCASVVSAVLATLLAIHLGFAVVVLMALGLYGLAIVTFPGK